MSDPGAPASPGESAAKGGPAWPAAAAYALTAVLAGLAMHRLILQPEFSDGGKAPALGSIGAVAFSLATVSVIAWFMRTTLLELALDFGRKQRNMRRLIRTTGWIGAGGAAVMAAWGAIVCLVPIRGVAAILLPLPIIWTARAVTEGWAASRIYGKSPALTLPLAVMFGGVVLLIAFAGLCFVEASYGRFIDAFRG